MSTITLYTADTPNGYKVMLYLAEAGLDYQRVNVDLGRGDQHQPAFLALNPNGKIPVLVDHDAGLTVFESCAILEYLSHRTGHLLPATEAQCLTQRQWLYFQAASLGPMLGQLWWFLHGTDRINAQALGRYRDEALRLYQVVETRLAVSPYLALPDYGIADIAAFAWLRTWRELTLDLRPFPHVQRWLQEIEARPAARLLARTAETRA